MRSCSIRQRFLRKVILLGGFCFLMNLFFLQYCSGLEIKTVTCAANRLLMREGPSQKKSVKGYLEKGETAFVIRETTPIVKIDHLDGSWWKAMDSKGTVGWVFSGYLKPSMPFFVTQGNFDQAIGEQFIRARFWDFSPRVEIPKGGWPPDPPDSLSESETQIVLSNILLANLVQPGDPDLIAKITISPLELSEYEKRHPAYRRFTECVFVLANAGSFIIQSAEHGSDMGESEINKIQVDRLIPGENDQIIIDSAYHGEDGGGEMLSVYAYNQESHSIDRVADFSTFEGGFGSGCGAISTVTKSLEWLPNERGGKKLVLHRNHSVDRESEPDCISKGDFDEIYDWENGALVLSTTVVTNPRKE